MKGKLSNEGIETYEPTDGGILWKPLLEHKMAEEGIELKPVYYREGDLPQIQVTQENTFTYINMASDELDAMVINYEHDEEGKATWFFRDRMDDFERLVSFVGPWALLMTSLYPLKDVIEVYEEFSVIPDELPEDFA